jgi:hypothetical protein
MLPASLAVASGSKQTVSPKRFVALCATLGFHAPFLFPDKAGRDWLPTPYLAKLQDHRDRITVLSGLSHPEQQGNNGHASSLTWLTSAKRPGLAGFRNTVSIDQVIAERVGVATRLPYLCLSANGPESLSWTRAGVAIPALASPSRLFQMLFIDGTKEDVARELRGLKQGRSILDTVGDRAKSLEQKVGSRDRQKLEEYLAAVRDLETRLQQSEGWTTRPKPRVDAKPPTDIADKRDAIGRQQLLYDMVVLALQTDSTRCVTLMLGGLNAVPLVEGVDSDWHGLSHHGKDPSKIKELQVIEEAEFTAFAGFLSQLQRLNEGDATLLDKTAVLFGSNLGNASSHDWHNLPIIVAGGGYRHGSYVAHDSKNNTPLANLFVDMARRMDVEIDSFGSSTGDSIRGLEPV